jgi:hypothetical protein
MWLLSNGVAAISNEKNKTALDQRRISDKVQIFYETNLLSYMHDDYTYL